MTSLPSYVDPEIWAAFIESRKEQKAPFTPLAQKLLIRRLMRAHDQGWDVNEALTDSAIYGWKSIYPKVRRVADEKDPTLLKIEADSLLATKPTPSVKEKIKELLGGRR